MHIHILTVGTNVPRWITTGYLDYAQRLPSVCSLRLVEIAPGRRSKGVDPRRAVIDEGERMLRAIPMDSLVIAMDSKGLNLSTAKLALNLSQCLAKGIDLALLVGGADGLAEACLRHSAASWSLSNLTFPHALVRVILAEQLYRAWTILQQHPYHRA